MCGFIGQISGIEQDRNNLLHSLKLLQRRGPDSQKVWSSADGKVTLLHTRLAITDKDPRAHQPFSNSEAGVTVVFNGEIYNHRELKDTFHRYHFCTNSDTEIVLASYITHGIDGISLLKGMFSLAIVDERLRKVILARDPIGKKPLFYVRWGNKFLFGISLLSIVNAYGKSVEVNKDALAYFWQHSYINSQTTILNGAMPVGPGEVLEFDWSGHLLDRYSCKPKPLHIYNGESQYNVNEKIAQLLAISVKRRLSDNSYPIILLSGGIDSTVIASVMKKIHDNDGSFPAPRAFSLASLIPFMNDEFYAVYAARRLGVQIHKVNPAIEINRLGDLIIHSLNLQDEPLGMPSFFLLERLVNAMSGYGRILLSGDGGDEVFLGYGRAADWHAVGIPPVKNEGSAPYQTEIPTWMSSWGRKTATDAFLGHMLAKADRASAEQGVELRCPLLDWDLVSYARSLPFEILTSGGRTKALLKDQLQSWPRWFVERPKIGFAYNLRWLWGLSRYAGLREVIDDKAIMSFEEYLPKALRRTASQWGTLGIFQHFEIAWRLLSWSLFLGRLDAAEKGCYVG